MKILSLVFMILLVMLFSGVVSGIDNSAAASLLDRIALGEGTTDAAAQGHGLASAYEITYAYGEYVPEDSKPLTEMTIGEVKQLQHQMLSNQAGNKLQSSAVGKYQLIRATLVEQQKELGLSDDIKFDAATQELFGLSLLEKRGYREWTEGKISDYQFQKNLAKEWASVADPDTGKSHYGQGVGTTDAQIKEAMAQTKSLLGIQQKEQKQMITLTLYIHDGSASGPVISGAQVTGQDGSGASFQQTTDSNGCVIIIGESGTWSFAASADGYEANSWSQPIAYTDTKDAFLTYSVASSTGSKSSGFVDPGVAALMQQVASGGKVESIQESASSTSAVGQPEHVAPTTWNSESGVVGKWRFSYQNCKCSPDEIAQGCSCDPFEITFNEDGTCIFGDGSTGKWVQYGDTVRFIDDSSFVEGKTCPCIMEGTINSDTMIFDKSYCPCDMYQPQNIMDTTGLSSHEAEATSIGHRDGT